MHVYRCTQASIGWKYSADSAVRVSLMWVHPESNASVEFLFGGKGDPKRYKRKRNERSMPNRSHFASIGAVHGIRVPGTGCVVIPNGFIC